MEFDVLNEILTGCVAQLFTNANANSTPAYKTSSQMGQDKSEIPRKSSYQEDLQQQTTDSPITQWLMIEAKQKYQQAMQKLGLDSQKVQGRSLYSQSVQDLNVEKRRVKNELKVYDQAFVSKFGRPPNRSEKEPMRNLYMYYKKLKQAIVKKGTTTGGVVAQRSGSADSNGTNQSRNLSVDSTKDIKNNNKNPENEDSDEGSDNGAAQNTVQMDQKEIEELKKQFGFKNQAQATQKMLELRQERKELRIKLDGFQKNFEQVNNRKIKYTSDITPVKAEFKKYKDLKVDVGKIEKLFKYLQK